MKVKLICHEKYKAQIVDILLSNNIIIDDNSNNLIAEYGLETSSTFDTKIVFKPDKMNEFINIISSMRAKGKIEDMIIGIGNGTYVPIKLMDICYFNAQNNDTYAHLPDNSKYLVKSKLYQLEEELSSRHFFRINKSELVNIKKITLITPMFKGKLLINLEGYDACFDISRGYTKEFKERLGF